MKADCDEWGILMEIVMGVCGSGGMDWFWDSWIGFGKIGGCKMLQPDLPFGQLAGYYQEWPIDSGFSVS